MKTSMNIFPGAGVERTEWLRWFVWFLSVVGLGWGDGVAWGAEPVPVVAMRVEVDASEATRRVLHTVSTMPSRKGGGTMAVRYPKWIPGEHGPTGPILELTGVRFFCEGKPVEWRRDAMDMYVFRVTCPTNGVTLEAKADFLLAPAQGGFSSGGSVTEKLLVLNWNQVVLYPHGASASSIVVTPGLRLPSGWKFGTALEVLERSGDQLRFKPVTLETLVDSPVNAGVHFRQVPLAPGHFIELAADSAEALEMGKEEEAKYSRLVDETGALFGARHYRSYHFLLSLSDHIAHFGLEHHESSDDRASERMFLNPDTRLVASSLLPHEMTHSWNGKHRRPQGLAILHYHTPMDGELLWVYEGLTTYLGDVLTARSGLWTKQQYLEALALTAAQMEFQAGRRWRPLVDTTTAAQVLYDGRAGGANWRRGVDFYPEGELIWLEADVLIRSRTGGQKSLDDFCRAFFGGDSGVASVRPYTLDDVIKALGLVSENDWKGFFKDRVYTVQAHAPLGGIVAGGWELTFGDAPTDYEKAAGAESKVTDFRFSIGLTLGEGHAVVDVVPASACDKAGVVPGMKLVAVNGRKASVQVLQDALKSGVKGDGKLELLLEHEEFFKTCRVEWKEGERHPRLTRVEGKPDLLGAILEPRGAKK